MLPPNKYSNNFIIKNYEHMILDLFGICFRKLNSMSEATQVSKARFLKDGAKFLSKLISYSFN